MDSRKSRTRGQAYFTGRAIGTGGIRMESQAARRLMLNLREATEIAGATRRDVGAATVLIHPTLTASSWNFAMDLDATDEGYASTIQKVEELFNEHKRYPSWVLGPYDRPTGLEERLKGLGYAPDTDRTVMYSDGPLKIDPPPYEGLEIERADEGSVDECIQIVLQRFGWPREWGKALRKSALDGIARGDDHYRMYYAALHGGGVATAFLVFSAGTAGIYGMATSKEYQGKGLGRHVLKRCVDDAFDRGVDVITLQVATGSRGEMFYEKAGFKKAYVAHKFGKGAGQRAGQAAPAAAPTTA